MDISPGWKIQKMVKKSWLSVKKMCIYCEKVKKYWAQLEVPLKSDTHTLLTQCQYIPHSNLIFQEHYHSQRHSKSSIFDEISEFFCYVLLLKNPKLMKIL